MVGILIMMSYCLIMIMGNYVDNCLIEWSNEYLVMFDFMMGFFFVVMNIMDNVFFCSNVVLWFGFILIKLFGVG